MMDVRLIWSYFLTPVFFPCFLLLHLQIYEIILVFIVIIVKTGGDFCFFMIFYTKKYHSDMILS